MKSKVEVILMDNLEFLGKVGDKVRVARGYAKNYLFPKSLAVPKNKVIIKQLEKKKEIVNAKYVKEINNAKKEAEKYKDYSCSISVETDANDKLYGSISISQIASVLAESNFNIDKKDIIVDNSIKSLGEHIVKIKLHHEVIVEIKVIVEKKS